MYQKYEKLKNERGITDYEVFKKTGISTATLSEWKKGTYQPKIDKIKKLADFFEVPITYFIGD
jgi:transcriptional regulator with XRE-family HTH domain